MTDPAAQPASDAQSALFFRTPGVLRTIASLLETPEAELAEASLEAAESLRGGAELVATLLLVLTGYVRGAGAEAEQLRILADVMTEKIQAAAAGAS